MNIRKSNVQPNVVKPISIGDYVDSAGDLVQGVPSGGVMVRSVDDLANLPAGVYEPGTMAYTAGYKGMWQLAADGTWVDMLADEEATDDETKPE